MSISQDSFLMITYGSVNENTWWWMIEFYKNISSELAASSVILVTIIKTFKFELSDISVVMT